MAERAAAQQQRLVALRALFRCGPSTPKALAKMARRRLRWVERAQPRGLQGRRPRVPQVQEPMVARFSPWKWS